MANLLEARSVYKWYGDHLALDNVSLEIPQGSIFGLLGPNGAGKTTLIRIVNQITYPDKGGVFFQGKPLDKSHIARIGYLPEERGLYKSMKVGEQALYLSRLKGLTSSEAKKRLQHWFEKFGIEGWWHKKVQELSKGMAQKIQFIVTVLHEPDLLIFDEPFSGFDPINANLIKEEILNLRARGATVIFSTHRMESVEEICDHIALIHRSRKILDGPLTEIKKSHKDNSFEVGLIHSSPGELRSTLEEKFSVTPAHFKTLGADLTLKIKPEGEMTPKALLSFLNSRAEVTHFKEVIPTANEIFIQHVKEEQPADGKA